MINKIEETAIKKFGSFRKFCIETKQDPTNFKRKLLANLTKIQTWIEPLGLEIQIAVKRKKREVKNKKNLTTNVD